MNILIAIDDSIFSDAVTNVVIDQIRPENTTLKLLHVLEPFPVDLAEKLGSKEFPDFAVARMELRDRTKKFLDRGADKLHAAGFQISCLLEEGDPRDIILDHALSWPAHLIMVGSHRHIGMNRFLLGSVSKAVAHHAHCSVEIVRIHAQEVAEDNPRK